MGVADTLGTGSNPQIPADSIAGKIKNPFSQKVVNKDRGADFPNGFEIIEYVNGKPVSPIDGTPLDNAGSYGSPLQLAGNLMPFQPFEWSGEQRLVKEYYPGNPEAAVQVLGPKEGPLNIKGRFKDKRYDPVQIPYGSSFQYTKLFEAIRKRGNLLRFGMSGLAGSWFRYGFLEDSNFKMNKLSWIDYSLTFFVVSETQPINNYFVDEPVTAPSTVNSSLITAMQNFQSTYSTIPTSMPQSIASKIQGLISTVAGAVNLVTGFVQTVLSTALEIEQTANRALGLIKNARTTLNSFRSQVDSLTHSFSTLSTQGAPAGQARDTGTNIAYIHEANAGTLSVSQLLAQMQAQFEAISVTVPKARYKVTDGDTLQNISVRFYNIADNWQAIYDHNKLNSTVLVPGTVLEIPKV